MLARRLGSPHCDRYVSPLKVEYILDLWYLWSMNPVLVGELAKKDRLALRARLCSSPVLAAWTGAPAGIVGCARL